MVSIVSQLFLKYVSLVTVSFFYMDMGNQTKHLQYLKNVIVQMIDADEIWFRLQPNLT